MLNTKLYINTIQQTNSVTDADIIALQQIRRQYPEKRIDELISILQEVKDNALCDLACSTKDANPHHHEIDINAQTRDSVSGLESILSTKGS